MTPTAVTNTCEECGRRVENYDAVSCGSGDRYEVLCPRCFNVRVADRMGLDVELPDFEDVAARDFRGKGRKFHIRPQFVPTGILLDAFEVIRGERGGYEFSVLGDFEEDPEELLAVLVARIRRGVARQHLTGGRGGRRIGPGDVVRGRVAWDPSGDGRVPLVVVDGDEVSWEELGGMLMTFEGFHFKLEIADRTEEI